MTRNDLVLTALVPAKGAPYQPAQVQKLFFLIDQNISEYIEGPHFNFEPRGYGPFDQDVCEELRELAAEGHVDICPEKTWTTYRLTPEGQRQGEEFLASLPKSIHDYIESISSFIHNLSFTQLVSAVYRAYPEMRVNGVFQNAS